MKIPVGRIPKFITASSLKGLQRSMLQVQARLGYGVTFFDIQFAGKQWVAFYYDNDDITLHNVEEKLGDTNS
jgi:hypothetical protein